MRADRVPSWVVAWVGLCAAAAGCAGDGGGRRPAAMEEDARAAGATGGGRDTSAARDAAVPIAADDDAGAAGDGGRGDLGDVGRGDLGAASDGGAMDGAAPAGGVDARDAAPAVTLEPLPDRPGASHTVTLPAPRGGGGVELQLWIPKEAQSVRGLLVVTNQGYAATLPYFRELAAIARFAVVGTNLSSTNAGAGDAAGLLGDGLKRLATASGRAEIAEVPLLLFGHSAGASAVFWLMESMPARVLAVAMSGHRYEPTNPQARKIPFFTFVTEFDPSRTDLVNVTVATRQTLPNLRAQGAPYAVAVHWDKVHSYAGSLNVVIPFFLRAIERRLPATTTGALRDVVESEGWLGNPAEMDGTFATIAPFAQYAGDRAKAPWLLDGYVAALWRAYNTKASPVTIQQPVPIDAGNMPMLGTKYAAFRAGIVPVAVGVAAGMGVAKVELLDGDRALGAVTAAPYAFAVELAAGFHALNAVVTEVGGRRHVSRVHTIFVR